jgi:hypothetical protein
MLPHAITYLSRGRQTGKVGARDQYIHYDIADSTGLG